LNSNYSNFCNHQKEYIHLRPPKKKQNHMQVRLSILQLPKRAPSPAKKKPQRSTSSKQLGRHPTDASAAEASSSSSSSSSGSSSSSSSSSSSVPKTTTTNAAAATPAPRERVCVIGATGCGKSSLVNSLLGKNVAVCDSAGAAVTFVPYEFYYYDAEFEKTYPSSAADSSNNANLSDSLFPGLGQIGLSAVGTPGLVSPGLMGMTPSFLGGTQSPGMSLNNSLLSPTGISPARNLLGGSQGGGFGNVSSNNLDPVAAPSNDRHLIELVSPEQKPEFFVTTRFLDQKQWQEVLLAPKWALRN
jgi:hypothetical protein